MRQFIVFSLVMFFASTMVCAQTMAESSQVYDTCENLPSFERLECKDKGAVLKASNELHACMKSRFTYSDQVYSAAWPEIEIPETGPITGGDAEWALGCMQAWPCKEKRLAFVEESGKEPHLAMVIDSYVVDYQLDKVYKKEDLGQHLVLRISGLNPDDPWMTVDKKKKK
jgi:hypothetical protein